jgi:hypothetical protein
MLDVVLKLLVQGIGLGLLDDGEFGLGRSSGEGRGWRGKSIWMSSGSIYLIANRLWLPHVMPANLLPDLPKNAAWNRKDVGDAGEYAYKCSQQLNLSQLTILN